MFGEVCWLYYIYGAIMRTIAWTDLIEKYSSGHHIELQGFSHKMLLKGTNCNGTTVEQLLVCDEVYTVYSGKTW